MTPFKHICFASKSDVGRKRKNNEDAFGVFPSSGVFCVADGMGGGDDGEIASAATVEAVRSFCEKHPLPDTGAWKINDWLDGISSAMSSASSWIYKRTCDLGLKDSGSTFVGLFFDPTYPSKAVAMHAGDSRLYHVRAKSIKQITTDHSVAEMIGVKSEKKLNPYFRGMILRAVGVQQTVELERTIFDIKEGDWIVLCSDGLSKMIDDSRIKSIVNSSNSPSEAAETLVSAANEAGGSDNITVVVVKVGPLPEKMPAVPFSDASIPMKEFIEGYTQEHSTDADTRETGETMQIPLSVEPPTDNSNQTKKIRRRLPSPSVMIALVAGSLLIVFLVFISWLMWRRAEDISDGEAARREALSIAVKEVSRQNVEKVRKRSEENETLRAKDEELSRKARDKERSMFQENVDLPLE